MNTKPILLFFKMQFLLVNALWAKNLVAVTVNNSLGVMRFCGLATEGEAPDIVVDEHGLMPDVTDKIPLLKKRCSRVDNLYKRN